MPDQPLDPLANFLGDLAEKIKVTKEHKNLMEAVYASASATGSVKDNNDPFASFLTKVGEAVSSKLPPKPTIQQITEIVENPEEGKATKELGLKIKNAIEKAKVTLSSRSLESEQDQDQEKSEVKAEEEPSQGLAAVKTLGQKIKDAIEKAKNKALDTPTQLDKSTEIAPEEDEQIASYIGELEKLKDTGSAPQKEEAKSTLNELKEYIDKAVKDYSRRILDLGSGGGSVAVQYAKGGIMDGDLNVNGHILSGGKNIANYFGTGGGSGGGDLNVNTVVYTSSAKWNDTYTTVNNYSGDWSSGLQTLAFNENDFNLSISSGNTVPLSSLKVDLSEVAAFSAYWADTRYNVTFEQNVTINGNLTALGSSTFKNTVFTTTSALSVVNTGPGPALYVFQSSGPYDVASFYDGDGIEVLHVGNAQGGGNPLGKVGINTSFPTTELTVNGQISSNNPIIVLNGNSNDWNSVYTTTQNNSGGWESTESTVNTYSASWTSTYNAYNSLSASYTTESLAIAYAVAL